MSYKVQAFDTAIYAPKTTHLFQVYIPSLPVSIIRVSSTTFPFLERGVQSISYRGYTLQLPINISQSGEWSCVYTEDVTMVGATAISFMQRMIDSKGFYPQDIIIYITDQYTGKLPIQYVQLKQAWLKTIDPIDLDQSDPTKPLSYKLTFVYSGLQTSV